MSTHVSELSNPGTVIVSGATFGIGREIAQLLARRGWQVVAFGLQSRQISSTAEGGIEDMQRSAHDEGLTIACLEADVSSEAEVERVFETALTTYGAVDAVVNNAAIGPLGTIIDTDPETWDQIMAVNLRGPYLMCRRAIVHMRERGGGRIVNVGSGAGWGKPNMAAYATSKGGLFTFSQALALDHFHDHINVNTVVPGGGGIESGMSLGRIVGDRSSFGRDALGTVAGRPATGEDIARAVAFLLSEDAAAISGTVVDVGCFSHQGGPPKAHNR